MTLIRMTVSKIRQSRRYNIQHNDTQYDDIQRNESQQKGLYCDTKHKGLICDTQHK
jgi:hypothetical protein